ncbi:branched-chain amino acid ABC transporter permease [Alcaligenaceae bacterium]|nr:branched-chain amino acid ABC transporter permease [Alcaligenaceae bacterium]
MKSQQFHYVSVIALALTALVVGQFLTRSALDTIIIALWFAYLCQTWNIIGGMAGQFSFAHPVYVAFGGYTSTLLYLHWDLTPWLGMLIGAIGAMLCAALLCWINFRRQLPMLTYALITLAITIIAVTILNTSDLLGGHEGLVIPRGNSPANFRFADKKSFYYIALAAVTAMMFLTLMLRRSRFGIRLFAIRDNQDAARMIGVDVLKTSLLASMLSAGLGALAGTFYAQYISVVDPSIAHVELAVQIVLMTAVGGIGTTWGPLLGPLLLVPVERYLSREFVNLAGFGHLFYGLVIIVILLLLRDGVVSWMASAIRSRIMGVKPRIGAKSQSMEK